MARPELSAAQVAKLTEEMVKIATDLGAKVLKKEDWGLRALAYPVKKSKKAFYNLVEFDAPAAAILEMERNMRFKRKRFALPDYPFGRTDKRSIPYPEQGSR
jgi:small subunit ribosomal protein S6